MALINKNIRYLRNREGWSQRKLAEKLGVTKSLIGAYEEFRAVPLIVTAVKIADAFNIDLDTLIKIDIAQAIFIE